MPDFDQGDIEREISSLKRERDEAKNLLAAVNERAEGMGRAGAEQAKRADENADDLRAWRIRAETAEARCAELSGALTRIRDLRASSSLGVTTVDVLGMVRKAARAALAQQGRPDPCRKDPRMLCPIVDRVADCSSECPYPDMAGPAREAPSAGQEPKYE